jgi:ABC-2 type transport system ATP-binding protein
MNSSEPRIELVKVSKWYEEVLGLNEVSLDLGPGVVGLLGPNGAGKSTLIKLVCGMLAPSLGVVRVNGTPPFDRPGVMRRVGLCPEQDPVYPDASAWEALTFLTGLHGYGRAEARSRARRALERMGLEQALGRSVAGYSKGMRQRFKLAQALAHDPDVLVLDEPLNGLDPPGRRFVGEVIRALGESGRCVLVSSHVLHEVDTLAQRMIVLSLGRVLADGSSRTLREEMKEIPLTIRVRGSDPAALASVLITLPGVQSVGRLDQGVQVITLDAPLLFDRIADLAGEGRVPVAAIETMDEDLEAVFRYLTR